MVDRQAGLVRVVGSGALHLMSRVVHLPSCRGGESQVAALNFRFHLNAAICRRRAYNTAYLALFCVEQIHTSHSSLYGNWKFICYFIGFIQEINTHLCTLQLGGGVLCTSLLCAVFPLHHCPAPLPPFVTGLVCCAIWPSCCCVMNFNMLPLNMQ